jgi:hypothetical protein
MSVAELAREDDELTVSVADPFGQQEVVLPRVKRSARPREVAAMAASSMSLPPNVQWALRDDASSRLLNDEDALGAFAAQDEPSVRLTLQPDASLG